MPVVSLTKGLERGSRKRMSEVTRDEMPGHPVAVLTGPNSLKVIVRSVRRIRSRKMPEMWRLTGEAFPEITL